MDLTLLAAMLVGLLSTLHCVGMCGGIMGALTFGLASDVRASRPRLWLFIAAYNAGRIGSYALAGALLGSLGLGLFAAISPEWGYPILQGLAALLLAGIGLYIGGWFPQFALLERVGEPLWRRIEPFARRLLPVNTPWQALLYGILWGWLPCGMVYSMLLWSMAAGGATSGALYMGAFGLGTLPAVMGTGLFGGWLTRFARMPRARQTAGACLILFALGGPFLVHALHPMGQLPGQPQPGCITDDPL